jgi:hypothetical protein
MRSLSKLEAVIKKWGETPGESWQHQNESGSRGRSPHQNAGYFGRLVLSTLK